MQYAQRSGEAVDWFLEKVPADLMETMTISYWPRHENMLAEIAGQKFWTGTVQWGMGNEHNMTEVYTAIHASLAELPNLELIYDRKGYYLEKDGDTVAGVVAVDAAGNYHRYRANEAVVLAAGDFGANKEMMTDLCVTANDVFQEGITEWKDPMGAKDGSGIPDGRVGRRPLGAASSGLYERRFRHSVHEPRRGHLPGRAGQPLLQRVLRRPHLDRQAGRAHQADEVLYAVRLQAEGNVHLLRVGSYLLRPARGQLANVAAQFDRGLPLAPRATGAAPSWPRTGHACCSTWASRARPRTT